MTSLLEKVLMFFYAKNKLSIDVDFIMIEYCFMLLSLMKLISAKYLKSSPNLEYCPDPDRPEYAFIGRSNVGKSSLINAICHRKNLAQT
jgi:ribosome biogenesis GTPase A